MKIGKVFQAKYAGTCACCHKPFETGDWVVYVDDELVREECMEEMKKNVR